MTDAEPDADDDQPEGDTKRAEVDDRGPVEDAGDRVAQRIRRVLDHGLGGQG